MFALTIEIVYLVMMMMIQVLFQHVVWKVHMM